LDFDRRTGITYITSAGKKFLHFETTELRLKKSKRKGCSNFGIFLQNVTCQCEKVRGNGSDDDIGKVQSSYSSGDEKHS
jgi:hypothetical protein